jgi:RimJ/RimL family protein N-acetyltransferase
LAVPRHQTRIAAPAWRRDLSLGGVTIHGVELLRTKRLLLRDWHESDLAAFFDLYSREDVIRWLGPHPRRPLATREEARDRLRRWRAHDQELSPPLGLWAIVPLIPGAEPGQPIGTLLLLPLSDARGPTGLVEVGWHLHPSHQGQGYATEAARAILAAGGEAGIDEVLALTDLDNVASQRVTARLGMQDEGVTERWFGLAMRQYRTVIGPREGHT